jgi:hypothetical protein
MPGKPLPRTRFDAAAALRRRTRRSGMGDAESPDGQANDAFKR